MEEKRLDSSTDTSSARSLSIDQRIAGLNGCIGSSDATHVPMLRCPHRARNSHKGFKLSVLARTRNVTCDHSGRILGATMGHPGTC